MRMKHFPQSLVIHSQPCGQQKFELSFAKTMVTNKTSDIIKWTTSSYAMSGGHLIWRFQC